MSENTGRDCPNCGYVLDKFNGHIGFCPVHKWVSPKKLGFDAEAEERNRKDAADKEAARLKEEKIRLEEDRRKQEEHHRKFVRKVVAVIVVLCLIAAGVVFFVVRPGMNYSGAGDRFAAGEYIEARDAYAALGDYKDASSRVILCDAMVDLQQNRPEDAAAKLDQLTGDGQTEIAGTLAQAILPVVENWQDRGLTPNVLLMLLQKADTIDPKGTLDREKLSIGAHIALLDGSQIGTYVDDINSDGEDELVVLDTAYAVNVYRMATEGNMRVAVDNDMAAACMMRFGEQFEEEDMNKAVDCYAGAYRLLPGSETRAALTAAYQTRAKIAENAGNMEKAIADARSAMETSGQMEDFLFFYDINLRNCKNGNDAAAAIAMWNAFADDARADIARYAATNRWKADAAQMHIALADELSAKKDEACIAELRTAAEMGADVHEALSVIQSRFEPGFALARLLLLEKELFGDDSGAVQQTMVRTVRTAISEWKTYGILPENVPELIHFADEQAIDLSGIDRDALYQEAAVAAAGRVAQYSFVNWNSDAYPELLTLDVDGKLSLHGLDDGTWRTLSSIDTRMSASDYRIISESAPVILVSSEEKDEILALTGNASSLTALFREQDIQRLAVKGTEVTFSRKLEGSIDRYVDYAYEADGTDSRPVRAGVDWQQNNYPLPKTAVDAVQRYFEAKTHDISGEMQLLSAESEASGHFDPTVLAKLAAPDASGTIHAQPYYTDETKVLFELSYPSETQTIRAWIAVENIGGWKLTGAAHTYGEGRNAAEPDTSIDLLSLNAATEDQITAKGSRKTYRIMVPSAGRLSFEWQSGEKAASRVSHAVAMYADSMTGETLFSYELQPSLNKQRGLDRFVSAGVYYITVEARMADAAPYTLHLSFDPETNVELEDNDTSLKATPVALNTAYSASLSAKTDVDFFSFTLEETSAVNVLFTASGNGKNTAAYAYAVYSGADASMLSIVNVPGNAQLAQTGNLYLAPGTYFVQVAKGSAHTAEEYTVTVNASPAKNTEAESNNALETANPVPVNQDILASTGREGDVDCFSFIVDHDSVFQPRMSFKPTENNSKTYVLTLADAAGREMFKVNIKGKESSKIIPPIALTPGKYTLKVENPAAVLQDYTLSLLLESVETVESEPNNAAAAATQLKLGEVCTGMLTSAEDIDWYKLTFDVETPVTFDFSFPQSSSGSTCFVLSIEQNGKTAWNVNIKGNSGGIEQQLQFKPGEYYIRIKPSEWLSSIYTLSVK